MKGAQRSVTPEAFSAGTTAKVSSGYLLFQSCADAADAENASTAAASTMRRLIMELALLLWFTRFGRSRFAAGPRCWRGRRGGLRCGARERPRRPALNRGLRR